jgi:outer membrane protein assembly factor BamB
VTSGDPRSLTLAEPARQGGAACGFVDTLDFPLDPPDAATASGGGDFARFRERYNGYHAGEDWRFGRLTSFGKPIYSIGHGRVVYAEPLGWGADKGVVIVEHTFRGGRRLLSFYGHLDPPSVTLLAGQCLARGDHVGDIGDPRTSPHLHFEIRVHLPDTPGPGYWPSDPRRAGWRPPSATIWFERMAAMPGVRWGLLRDNASLTLLGELDGMLLVASASGEVLALDAAQGRTLWSRPLADSLQAAVMDADGTQLYAVTAPGRIQAFAASALLEGDPPLALWTLDLGLGSPLTLAPLPGGGVLGSTPSATVVISSQGAARRLGEFTGGIIDWTYAGSALVALADDRVWSIEPDRATSWEVPFDGRRIVASQQPFVYASDGLYRLDLAGRSAELVYSLPRGLGRSGDLAKLPDGGHLLAHSDPADSRLIAFAADGRLRWERSLRNLGSGPIRLLAADEHMLAVVGFDVGNSGGFDIYRVDPDDGDLLRLFSGGTRASGSGAPELWLTGTSVLIGVTGVGLISWDPQTAMDAIGMHLE